MVLRSQASSVLLSNIVGKKKHVDCVIRLALSLVIPRLDRPHTPLQSYMDPARLYVKMPGGEVLQMCLMLPTAEQLCPPLPFLLRAPELKVGLPQLPLPAERVLSWRSAADAQPAASCSTERGDLDASEILATLERALACGDAVLPDVSRVPLAEWRRALGAQSTDPLVDVLREPARLCRTASAAQSEAVCDLMLEACFPRLLEGVGIETAEAWPDSAPAEVEPLPVPLSEALMLLLHSGSTLRLAPDDFDARVTSALHTSGRLGPRAAAQAALVYTAVVTNRT